MKKASFTVLQKYSPRSHGGTESHVLHLQSEDKLRLLVCLLFEIVMLKVYSSLQKIQVAGYVLAKLINSVHISHRTLELEGTWDVIYSLLPFYR